MAHVQTCKYCPESVVNSQWHPECRLAKLEGLLYRIRQRISRGIEAVSNTLEKEILAETFRSKEEIEREREDTEQRRIKKGIWEAALEKEIQEAVADWKKIHPDPNPPTC